MVWQIINGTQQWVNSSQIFQNITNSTSPVAAIQNTIVSQFPWFWPLFPFLLYLWMLSGFADSPDEGKAYMIAALAFVVSAFLAIGNQIPDAIIQFIIFLLAFWLSKLFNKPSGISG